MIAMDMTPFQKLTEEEINQFREGVETWVASYSEAPSEDMAPADIILHPWDVSKQTLFDMFGQELILSKDITYEKSQKELESQLYNLLNDMDYDFVSDYKEKILWEPTVRNKNHPVTGYSMAWYLDYLFSTATLASNRYNDHSFFLTSPKTGKQFEVTKGCKTMKILGKIAEEFGLKGFEEFRLEHSRILNNKTLTGTLCLSIHPNDYATMSDNDYNWDSCMSWDNDGGYCQGTVEMMNSPIVVVAYVKGNDNFNFGDDKWSNKKWRELFIVHPQVITEIAPYPYESPDISKQVLSWLKKLVVEYGWTQFADSKMTVWQDGFTDTGYRFEFSTGGVMYNDFRFKHKMYLANNLSKDEEYTIIYSGVTECLWCGESVDNWQWESLLDHEGRLVCNECDGTWVCEYCGERVRGIPYSVDGQRICNWCYEEHTGYCEECGETVLEDNIDTIRVCNIEQGWFSFEFEYRICANCRGDFVRRCTKSHSLVNVYDPWNYCLAADINDLTEEGAQLFAEESIEDFINYCPNDRVKKKIARYTKSSY